MSTSLALEGSSTPQSERVEPGPGVRARSGPAPSPLAVGLLTAFLCLIWGSTWIVIKEGLADLPAFKSAGARFTLAALAMTLAAGCLSRREGGVAPPWRLSSVVGLLNFALSYGIVYWSETKLPSGVASVLWSVFPMLTACLGHFFLPGESLRTRQWSGFVVGFLGVVFLFSTDLRDLGPEAIPAALILLASPLVSAIGTIYVKRAGAGVNSILLNRNAMWIGAGCLCALGWTVESDSSAHWSGAAIGSVAYLAVIGTVVTFGLYFWLLRHAAANKLSLIAYVTPAIALFLGWSLGDEPIGADTLTGSFLILVGVFLVAGGRRH